MTPWQEKLLTDTLVEIRALKMLLEKEHNIPEFSMQDEIDVARADLNVEKNDFRREQSGIPDFPG